MARQLRRDEYTVGWVCALYIELAAAQEMLDQEHKTPPPNAHDAHDTNIYTYGRIGEHNIVIACLPEGQTGTQSAATVAAQMKLAFPAMRFGLMVGVGGGVPSEEVDIRLGDVVVSKPYKAHGGVVQYDSGKATPSGFERTGSLNIPPTVLLNAVSNLRAKHTRGRGRLAEYLSKLENLPDFTRDAAGADNLFEAEYDHKGGATCKQCDPSCLADREPRRQDIAVHYGTIASGNQVMRSATQRDRVSAELGGVLCFEMEAAGLMNSFPCLVIRGICDYADSHKNKRWQAYAAGTAVAYAKDLLSMIPPAEITETHTVEQAIRETDGPPKETTGRSEDHSTAPPLDLRSMSLDQDKNTGPQSANQTSDREFRLEEAVNRHMEADNYLRSGQAANHRITATGHRSPNISCQKCLRKFDTQSAANAHMAAVGHENPKFSCKAEMCLRTFDTQNAANAHMTSTGHGTRNISCRTCTNKFLTQSAADGHMTSTGHGSPKFSCKAKKCNRKYYTQSAANVHMKAVGH